MKKTIGIFTTTRAESGAFIPLINAIKKSKTLDYKLFVGGAHLAFEFGKTIEEIKSKGAKITDTFDYLLNEDSSFSLMKGCGISSIELAHVFKNHQFDLVCIAGDRFELVPIALSAILFKKPIIHFYGGEKTEGVIDEQVRHMLTKCSHLHFTASEEYSQNVIKMGEPAWRVFTAGELVIDQIVENEKLSHVEILKNLNLNPKKKTLLFTYHPVTLEFNLSPLDQIKNIFMCLKKFDFQVIITAPNSEVDREKVIEYIEKEVKKNKNYVYIQSLGTKRYYSLLPYCYAVIGNSSSGIIEAPFFKVPTINIGDRQKGRLRHESVIDTKYTVESITNAIHHLTDKSFQKKIIKMKFKLGNGHAADQIVKVLEKIKVDEKLMQKCLTFN